MDSLEAACFGSVLALGGSVVMIWGIYICSTGNLFGVAELVVGLLAIFFGTNILHRIVFKAGGGTLSRQRVRWVEAGSNGNLIERPQSSKNNGKMETKGKKRLPEIPLSNDSDPISNTSETAVVKEQKACSLSPIPQKIFHRNELAADYPEEKKFRPLPPKPENVVNIVNNQSNNQRIFVEKPERNLKVNPLKNNKSFNREEKQLSAELVTRIQDHSNIPQLMPETKHQILNPKNNSAKHQRKESESKKIIRSFQSSSEHQTLTNNFEHELSRMKDILPLAHIGYNDISPINTSEEMVEKGNEAVYESHCYEEVMPPPLLKKSFFKATFTSRVIDKTTVDKV